MIAYRSAPDLIGPNDLAPFFDDRLVGFATALTDGALMAHVALLEVIASHRGRGIGSALVRTLQEGIGSLYGFDLCCDDDVVPFYERLGFSRVAGMVRRSPEAPP